VSTGEALQWEQLTQYPDVSITGQLASIEQRIEEATAALFEIDENAKELQFDHEFEDGDEKAAEHSLAVARNVLDTMRVLRSIRASVRSIRASVRILRDVTGAESAPSAPAVKG
jgi:hypothetical protein